MNLDIVVVILFLLGLMFAFLAKRLGKSWLLIVAITTTVTVGLRALFLFEFGSGLMAAALSGLFLLGVVTSWYQVEQLRDERKGRGK